MEILKEIGARLREARRSRGWSREILATKAGLSSRFLVDVESGHGNIALTRLNDLCVALDMPLVSLLNGISSATALKSPSSLYVSTLTLLSRCSPQLLQEVNLMLSRQLDASPNKIALVGLRGAGKTTIGKKVAKRLKWKFIELDEKIEKTAGLTLQNIFEVQGEDYYRSLEKQTLMEFLTDPEPVVIAAAGGIVSREESFDLLRKHCLTFWLKANPEDHWNRVLKQDPRPITNYPNAFAQLQNLLRQRQPLYSLADFTINTSDLKPDRSVAKIVQSVKKHCLRTNSD